MTGDQASGGVFSPDDEPMFDPDPRIGSVIQGRFRLEALLGAGRTGRVYRATQFPMNRPVALKLIHNELHELDENIVRRFGVLIAKSARLSHPHTVTLIDYGASEKRELFVAMELIQGRSLSSIIDREAPLDWERASVIGLQIARSLRDAHYRNVIHRGLNTSNVFLVDGADEGDFVKVSDFGMFGIFPFDAATVRKFGASSRFLAYAAPEQLTSGPLDPRVDVYSLGCVLFEMLAGRPPFAPDEPEEMVRQQLETPPPTFEELGIHVPPSLENAIRGCLAKAATDRVGSMSDMMIRLKDVLGRAATADLGVRTAALPVSEITRSDSIHPSAPTRDFPSAGTLEEAALAPAERPRTRRSLLGIGLAAGAFLAGAIGFFLLGPSKPVTVALEVSSRPTGAEVFIDGEGAGSTPLRLDLPAQGEVQLILRKDGFLEAIQSFDLKEDRIVEFELDPEPEPEQGPAADEKEDEALGEDYKSNPY
ncbi:MAG: serine/threonine-protein kinase [Myxococcota bacterium]